MVTISRQAAIANGLIRYFTGEPCIKGHLSERIVSSRNCLQCFEEARWVKLGKDVDVARKEKEIRIIASARLPPPQAPMGAAYISLAGGYWALVDLEDYEFLSKFKWYTSRHKGDDKIYASRRGRKGVGELSSVLMHRQILGMGPEDARKVDHEDDDGLNNRRKNIRPATHSQNLCNRGITKNKKGMYKGVFFRKESGSWRACIRKDGKLTHLGTFYTEEEAAKVYDKAALELHGEFANLNFKEAGV